MSKNSLIAIHIAVAWLSVVVALALMVARAADAISFNQPLMVVTSGAEMDSTLAFWKHIQGRPVFEDPHRIPFVASAYNWLYYGFYGEVGGVILKLFSLDFVWLPTVGRWISLAWAAVGAGLLLSLLRRAGGGTNDLVAVAPPFAIFAFFGPLVGFWAVSNNVELAATVCGVAGSLAFVTWYDAKPMRAIVLATLFSYLAWSFKQTHIFLAATLVLFLLLRRDWRSLSVMLLLHGAGWGAAIMLGSDAYVKILFFKGTDATLELGRLWVNLVNVAVKSTPIIAAATALIFLALRPRRSLAELSRETTLAFALVGLSVCLVLVVPMSAKQGASENYYFPLMAFLLFATFTVVGATPRPVGPGRVWHAAAIAGWLAMAAACVTVLLGYSGVVSVRPWHDRHVVQRDCIKGTPGPLLPVGNLMLSLPWLSDAEPRFNVFFNYAYDRAAGRWFEEDGVAGLIRKRYFGTIAVAAGSAPSFDGAAFEGYTLVLPGCGGLDIYVRK